MPAYGFGDIVLVPFPFSDQSGAKKRPAVIVSGTAYNEARRDVVIMAITSQIKPSGTFGEVIVQDWQAASLLRPSAIKPVLATIERIMAAGAGQPGLRDGFAANPIGTGNLREFSCEIRSIDPASRHHAVASSASRTPPAFPPRNAR